MNKKGLVTFFELIVLAIVSVTLLVAYQMLAQSQQETVLARVAEQEIKERCTTTLLSTYGADYKRYEAAGGFYGSYANLSDHYGGLPIVYIDTGSEVALSAQSTGVTDCNQIAGTQCYLSIFDPFEMLRNREALCRIGLIGK
jgi:hypothetical protein